MFINETGIINTIIQSMNNNVTGSDYITYLFIFFAILMMCVLMRIPIEFASLLVLPLVTVLVAYKGEWLISFAILLIFAGLLTFKNFIISER